MSQIPADKAFVILNSPPGRDRDRFWSWWLARLSDDDLFYLVGLTATILATRHKTTEGSMMQHLTELAKLQDAAARAAAQQAATS